MTLAEIRNMVHVYNYTSKGNNCRIYYYFNGRSKSLSLYWGALKKELIAIGSIEENDSLDNYVISQWEAISIAIRHEYAKALEEEPGMIDINKAIDKLKHNK